MPEERMIRINYPDKTLDNDVDIRVHLYYYDPNGQLQTPIFGINKEDVELAPSKDWSPYCFSKNCCTTKHLGILSDMEPCKSCPYRKME